MTQLTLTEPPAEPVTSTDAAMLFHWIDNGDHWPVWLPAKVGQLFASELGSKRPFDGPPDPYRKMWSDGRTRKALFQLEAEGAIQYKGRDGDEVWPTDEGRRRYGRMNLNDHLRNRSKK